MAKKAIHTGGFGPAKGGYGPAPSKKSSMATVAKVAGGKVDTAKPRKPR